MADFAFVPGQMAYSPGDREKGYDELKQKMTGKWLPPILMGKDMMKSIGIEERFFPKGKKDD